MAAKGRPRRLPGPRAGAVGGRCLVLRQVSRSVRGSRRDAERERDDLRHRRGREPLERPAGQSFGAILDEWLAMRERQLSPSTVEGYLGDI